VAVEVLGLVVDVGRDGDVSVDHGLEVADPNRSRDAGGKRPGLLDDLLLREDGSGFVDVADAGVEVAVPDVGRSARNRIDELLGLSSEQGDHVLAPGIRPEGQKERRRVEEDSHS
jgi:hypothetical protein